MIKFLLQNSFLIILLISGFQFSSCNPKLNKAITESQISLENGIYLITRSGNKATDILPLSGNEKIITFNQEFIDKTDQDVKYLVVHSEKYAPLLLKEKPKTELQEDRDNGRKKLLLAFNDEGKEKLKNFTTEYVNQMTTIIVNNEALTKHKIRTVIDGGFLQITRCTDNACEMLDIELSDNIIPNQ